MLLKVIQYGFYCIVEFIHVDAETDCVELGQVGHDQLWIVLGLSHSVDSSNIVIIIPLSQ